MSNTNFLTRLGDRPEGSLKLINMNSPEYETVTLRDLAGKNQVLQKSQSASHVCNQYDVIIPALTVPAGVLNSGRIDFRVPTNNLNFITSCTLQMTIAETGGANSVTLLPAPLIIDYIQIYSGNGQTLIEQRYGDELWLDNAWRTAEQMALLAPVENTTATYGAGTAISAGASATYYVPVECHLSRLELFAPAIRSDYLFRVYFRSTTAMTEAGTGTPSLSAANLIFKCTDLAPVEFNRLMSEYASYKHTFRYIQPVRQTYTQALAASSAYTLQLNGVNGLAAYFQGLVRSANTGAPLRGSDANIATIDLRNNVGQSMIGGQPLNFPYLRYVKAAEYYPSSMLVNIPFLWYSHAEDPLKVWKTNVVDGFNTYTGLEQLYITTGASISPGTFFIDLYFMMYGIVEVDASGAIQQYSS